ncbi:restriction endonuclease subunit S [Nocardia sp. NPDC058058]|uniref:restriction endonuclease subunit S n=1 Tax=Nocardia sp. NPDC058058 TaxID=3346317 RepID=UPI0036D898F3
MTNLIKRSLLEVVSSIVDNRGRTCPTADSGFPLIATNCLKSGVKYPVFENIRYVDEVTYESWFRAHPEPGDILFVTKGSPGRVAVVSDPVTFCIAQDMVALRANEDVVDSGYLYYRLLSLDVQSKIGNMHVGTMIPHFKKGDFGKLFFDVHVNIGDQRAIAEVLGALDGKIAANDEVIIKANQLASAVLESSLNGSTVSLVSIAEITMGSSPPGSSYNENSDGMCFYQGVRDFGIRYPSNRVWTTEPGRTAEKYDTLVSVRAPVGRLNLANESLCIGRGLAGVRSRTDSPMTLFHQIGAAKSEWAPFEAEGTIFGSINKTQLAAIQVPMVSADAASQLEVQLGSLEAMIASSIQENMLLERTRDQLLPLLISGKLRVKDAEKLVEEVV